MKRIVYLLLLVLLGTAACNKKEVDPLHFDVTTQKTSYQVGDTVNFTFTGNPDLITFYAGEEGSRYDHRNDLNAAGDALTDVGSALKDITTKMDSYQFVYSQPGTYPATFVAANTTIYGSRTIIKTIDLTIAP